MTDYTEKDLIRFYEKVQLPNDNGCMEWRGGKIPTGYGQFHLNGVNTYAHRFAYQLAYGEIPEGSGYHGTVIRHRCDNPSCVNPEHLEAGTQADNIQDKMMRGRYSNGRDRRTHCPRGHALEGKNLDPHALREGRRRCYACVNARTNQRYWRKKGVIWTSEEFIAEADRLFARYTAAAE